MIYRKRIIDTTIDLLSGVFNAINIIGPKGCGKTTTAKQRVRTVIEFQDEEKRENYLRIMDASPSHFLLNPKPILFDEWQDAPKIWGTIRKDCDDHPEDVGSYYLTGSSSKRISTPHTGTLRISTLKMYPMSLYESGLSNGQVSLLNLFDDPNSFHGCASSSTIDDIIDAICIGGWPRTLEFPDKSKKLLIARDLFRQTYTIDMPSISGIDMNPNLARAIIQSYARNICTLANTKTIFDDVSANFEIGKSTYFLYEKGNSRESGRLVPLYSKPDGHPKLEKAEFRRSLHRRFLPWPFSGVFPSGLQDARIFIRIARHPGSEDILFRPWGNRFPLPRSLWA